MVPQKSLNIPKGTINKSVIDFIKLNISSLGDDTICVPAKWTSYHMNVDGKTGALRYVESKYYNMDGKLHTYPKRKELKGSLHTLHNRLNNQEAYNWDQFGIDALKSIVRHLVEHFGIDPATTIIENLEYGLNLEVEYPPAELLSNSLIAWAGKPMNKNLNFDSKGKFYQVNTSECFIKFYDKSKQQAPDKSILRIEKHIQKNRLLRSKFGINVLSDLTNSNHLNSLLKDLIATVNKCLIVDSLFPDQSLFTKKEKETWSRAINPKFWELGFRDRTARHRFMRRLSLLLEKHNLQCKKTALLELIDKTGKELLMCNDITEPKKTPICNDITALYTVKPLPDQSKPRTCPITGLSISTQRTDSKYLSAKSISHLFLTDRKSYLRVRALVRLRAPKPKTRKERFRRLAHAIRCKGRREELRQAAIQKGGG